jgi:hypothetical protein
MVARQDILRSVVQLACHSWHATSETNGKGDVMKRAILILSIVAIVFLAIGLVVAIGAGASVAANCTTDASGQATCPNNAATTSAAGGVLIGILLISLGGLSSFVAWILGLIKTAQVKAWGWFVAVLLVSPLGSLIYGIGGPDQAPVPQYASPQYSGYPPQGPQTYR